MTLEKYRFFCYDINTNTKLTEIEATKCTFDSRLNDAGSFMTQMNLGDPTVQKTMAPLLPYAGWPYKLYVVRDPATIVWSGYIWQNKYQKAGQILTLSGKEMLSFADSRVVPKDYVQSLYPSGLDPAVLLQTVINDVQSTAVSGAGASWGLQVVTPTTGLYPIIPGYPKSQKTTIAQIISDVTQIIEPGQGGVDVTVTSNFNAAGIPVDTLTIWFPRAGRNATQTGVRIRLDDALDYVWQNDASQAGTNVEVTGAGNGAAMPEHVVQSPWTGVGGLGQPPRIDVVKSYSHLQTQSMVTAMAGGVANVFGQPLLTPYVIVPSDGNLGTWAIGDDCTVISSGDPFFQNGLNQDMRIVEYYTTLQDVGVSNTKVTLNSPPAF